MVSKMTDKEFWKEKWVNPEDRIPNPFTKKVYKILKDKQYKKLLDIGCGDGRDTLYFAKKGFHVTAVDFSTSGIEHLQKEKEDLNITCLQGKIQDIQFSENSFDVIYAHLSLHYFDDKITTNIFTNLHSILKKNGMICIKVKSTNDKLCGKGKKIEENMYLYEDQIRHFFDKKYLKEKLHKFKIINIEETSSVYYEYKSKFLEAIATK